MASLSALVPASSPARWREQAWCSLFAPCAPSIRGEEWKNPKRRNCGQYEKDRGERAASQLSHRVGQSSCIPIDDCFAKNPIQGILK
jgi:hypothetical protein